MHITYASQLCYDQLMQGDVLELTPKVKKLLEDIHPHFHDSSKNLLFMVLTQSCDLVQRGAVQLACKAPYITIVPVRSLDLVLERYLAQFNTSIDAVLPVMSLKSKTKATEFLNRLFNNNEPGYFYLDSEDTPLTQDCVAILNLSIAVKSNLHYKTCLEAKILQLDNTFQAKLGWLVGQMYSRVGTEDWESEKLKAKIKVILGDTAIWIEDQALNVIPSLLNTNSNEKVSHAQIQAAIKKIPSRKDKVMRRIKEIIDELSPPGMQETDKQDITTKLIRRLESDAALTEHLKK